VEPNHTTAKKAWHSSSYLFHGADHLPIQIPGGSVVDPQIFLSDPDPRIRNPELRIRIRIQEAIKLRIWPDPTWIFLWALKNMNGVKKVVNHKKLHLNLFEHLINDKDPDP
jgi:hypothetical protein